MPSNFKSTISKFYRKFLQLLSMSDNDNPRWCGVPFNPTPVHDYCDRLQAQYKLDGVESMESFIILQVNLYKTRATSRHEYLSAMLLAPDGSIFNLAFERGRGEIDDIVDTQAQIRSPSGFTPPPKSASCSTSPSRNPSETHLPLSSSHTDGTATRLPDKSSYFRKLTSASISSPSLPSSSSSVASLDSLFPKRNADDKVSSLGSSGKHNDSDEVFRTLSFPNPSVPPSTFPASSTPLHLYELAILANTLHDMTRTYLLFSDNCYFYAGTIVKVLEEVYRPTVVVNTTGSADTDRELGLPSAKKKEKESKAGTWYGIEVYAGEKIDTVPLKQKFKMNLEIFREPVQEYEDSRNAKVVQLHREAELRKAAEGGELREAEAREAAEEALHREAERRKAAEAEILRLKLLLVQMAKPGTVPAT